MRQATFCSRNNATLPDSQPRKQLSSKTDSEGYTGSTFNVKPYVKKSADTNTASINSATKKADAVWGGNAYPMVSVRNRQRLKYVTSKTTQSRDPPIKAKSEIMDFLGCNEFKVEKSRN